MHLNCVYNSIKSGSQEKYSYYMKNIHCFSEIIDNGIDLLFIFLKILNWTLKKGDEYEICNKFNITVYSISYSE